MKSILVVEDDATVLAFASTVVKMAKHLPVQAGNGLEALEILRSGLPVDAIISDIMMPGMNGIDLVKAARIEWPDVPVLLMSGFAGNIPEGAKALLQENDINFLAKPFTPAQLLLCIDKLFSVDAPEFG